MDRAADVGTTTVPLRLFVAVVPPPTVVDQLDRAVAPLRGEYRDLRWTAPDQTHLTLAFLGDVDPHQVPGLRRSLGEAVATHPVSRLRLEGVGTFPEGARTLRALWADVGGDRDRLDRLASSVDAAARRVVTSGAEQGFRAHVTLGHARAGCSPAARPLIDRLAGMRTDPWSAATVHLIHSVPGPAGHRHEYTAIAEFPLGG